MAAERLTDALPPLAMDSVPLGADRRRSASSWLTELAEPSPLLRDEKSASRFLRRDRGGGSIRGALRNRRSPG
jgi:hypothetical protein